MEEQFYRAAASEAVKSAPPPVQNGSSYSLWWWISFLVTTFTFGVAGLLCFLFGLYGIASVKPSSMEIGRGLLRGSIFGILFGWIFGIALWTVGVVSLAALLSTAAATAARDHKPTPVTIPAPTPFEFSKYDPPELKMPQAQMTRATPITIQPVKIQQPITEETNDSNPEPAHDTSQNTMPVEDVDPKSAGLVLWKGQWMKPEERAQKRAEEDAARAALNKRRR